MAMSLEQVFLENIKASCGFGDLSTEAQDFIRDLSKQLKSDFASPNGGYFSLETQEAIAREGAERLAQAIAQQGVSEVTIPWVQKEWSLIVGDFYRTQSWGHETQKKKPAVVLTQDQKIVREIAPYIWAAFQAWIVMKMIIYYFGTEAANNPEETPVFLYLGIAFSFGSLFFFAWRKYKKGD